MADLNKLNDGKLKLMTDYMNEISKNSGFDIIRVKA